ncbi:MAG: adenylate kinase [Rhodothermia bacterium]|nr:MAG: adenylate kinase [Rhodothermia bacterium]
MRIALFGAPGVGKGSQAALLNENESLKHISTGIILRKAIADDSDVGREAKRYMESGALVPGSLVRKLAEEAISNSHFDQFVLDGYPRTIEQAEWLTEFLETNNAPLLAVVFLSVPDDVIVNRISNRRVNVETGENFHLEFKPPPSDIDPSLIVQRDDDRPEAILNRLLVYHEETRPVEDYFRERDLLLSVDGVGSFQEVHDRVTGALKELQAAL